MADSTITTPHGELALHVATPTGAGPWPGVVVIHDAFGMTQDLRNQCDWLAGEGLLTVAPDLVGGRNVVSCMVTIMREVRAGKGRSFEDIAAARTWLAGHDDCTERIAVLGFCMGGGLALVLAPDGGFDAASVNYGTAPKWAYDEGFLRRACPIVASYGRKDRMLRGAAARLSSALTAAGVDHDVEEYPDAGHSFLNDHEGAGDRPPLLFAVLGKLTPGDGYHEASALDARRRIVDFLHAHLAG